MDPKDPVFAEALSKRIVSIRWHVKTNKKFQIRGKRFNDAILSFEGVTGAVMVQSDPQSKGILIKEAAGLDFDPSQVKDGKYDMLIQFVLWQLAHQDFVAENSLDLH